MQTKGNGQAEGFHDRAYLWRSTVTVPPSVLFTISAVQQSVAGDLIAEECAPEAIACPGISALTG
jgi:hypothetical protein